jgi:hypothetical protein
MAPNPCFVIMDPSVLSLKKREKKTVSSEIYGNHSNEVNPPLKLSFQYSVIIGIYLRLHSVFCDHQLYSISFRVNDKSEFVFILFVCCYYVFVYLTCVRCLICIYSCKVVYAFNPSGYNCALNTVIMCNRQI